MVSMLRKCFRLKGRVFSRYPTISDDIRRYSGGGRSQWRPKHDLVGGSSQLLKACALMQKVLFVLVSAAALLNKRNPGEDIVDACGDVLRMLIARTNMYTELRTCPVIMHC